MSEKQKKQIFVIMPFTKTPSRKQNALDEFFRTYLKRRIESDDSLKYQYRVTRSADSFDITQQIIRDIYEADIVLCDLSGHHANPNVMYELGVRLSVTNKPVILFREEHKDNKSIFDITGFYTYAYDPAPDKYRKLEDYIISKIRKFESGDEEYKSPVLQILNKAPSVIEKINRTRTAKILTSLLMQTNGLLSGFIGALLHHLDSNGIQCSFTTPEKTLDYFNKNIESLKQLSWEQLSFSPHMMPALNAYLIELPLTGLINEKLERHVNTFISQFYSCFFSNQYPWSSPVFNLIYAFLSEGVLLSIIIDRCMLLIREHTREEADEAIQTIEKILEQSYIYSEYRVYLNASAYNQK